MTPQDIAIGLLFLIVAAQSWHQAKLVRGCQMLADNHEALVRLVMALEAAVQKRGGDDAGDV